VGTPRRYERAPACSAASVCSVENAQLGVGWGDFVDFVDDDPEDDESFEEDDESLEDDEDESLEDDEDDSLDEEEEDDAAAVSAVDCLPRLSLR
jgi:hypothetical protein